MIPSWAKRGKKLRGGCSFVSVFDAVDGKK